MRAEAEKESRCSEDDSAMTAESPKRPVGSGASLG